MQLPKRKYLLPLLLLSALATPQLANADFKCWTNKDGGRECGNTIPPEYAQQQSETYNNQGLNVEVQKRAKTQAEIEAEQKRQAAEAKKAAEEKAKQAKQATYDRVLLSTFTSVKDITDSRDRKLAAIDATIEVTNASISSLHGKLEDYQRRAANYERSGKEVPDDLTQDMNSVRQQIADKQAYITSQQQEETHLRQEYAGYINRFKELKGAQ